MSTRRLGLTGLVSLCLLVGLFGLSTAPAFGGAISHNFVSQITGVSPGEPFSEPWGLAFDSSGDLLAADGGPNASQGAVDVFDPADAFVPPQLAVTGYETRDVAVSAATGDIYVENSLTHNGTSSVYVFKPEGNNKYGLVEEHIFGSSHASYITVDNSVESSDPRAGDVYILGGEDNPSEAKFPVLHVFKPGVEGRLEGEGEEVPASAGGFSFAPHPNSSSGFLTLSSYRAGLAVDPTTGNVYVANPGNHVVDVFNDEGVELPSLDITGSGVPASVLPFTPIAVAIDGGNDAAYVVDEASHVVDEFSLAGTWLGQIKQTTPGQDLEDPLDVSVQEHEGPTKGDVYVSDLATKAVDVFSGVATLVAPQVVEGSEAALNVTSDSGTIGAEIDPWGSQTSYHFEYGTSEAYGTSAPTPEGQAGTGIDPVEVQAQLQSLQMQTTYHYRVVAVGEVKAGVFETVYGPDRTFTTQRAGSELGLPDGREWELVTPPEKHGALFYKLENEGSVDIQASAEGDAIITSASAPTEVEPPGYSNDVQVLSTRGVGDWSSQVIDPPHNQATGPSIGEASEYKTFSEDVSLGVVEPFGNFVPLSPEASEATPYVRADYLNGNVEDHCEGSCYQPLVTAANTPTGTAFGNETDGQCEHFICGPHFVGATPDLSHIVLESPVQLTSIPNEFSYREGGFYEWSGGRLQPLYMLPAGEGGGGVDGGEPSFVYHQLSDDGSVFFSHGGHFYLDDSADGDAVRLDVAQGVSEPGTDEAVFLYADSDGSKVFFSDPQQLTQAAGGGVYECRIVETSGGPGCELSLTGLSSSRSLLGGSDDASYLYFLSGGKVYVGHYDGHEWTTTEGPVLPLETSKQNFYRVSSDGRYLAFMSSEELTGYNTHDSVNGQPDQEVYLYDANTSRLVCASCDPTGARPTGFLKTDSLSSLWTASYVPRWKLLEGKVSGSLRYQERYLSDSGRLFFDSNDALVPQDVNGIDDVYEYEPVGVGSCGAGSVTFSERSDGCVSLISSGTSPDESQFLDASKTGGDVFFRTLAKLSPQDFDDAFDVYDAHECSTAEPCFPVAPVVPPACSTGDSCKAAPSPQPSIFGPTPSATFSGAGNTTPLPATSVVAKRSLTRAQKLARALKACRKKTHGQRAVCDRNARKRYGPTQPRKANVKRKGR